MGCTSAAERAVQCVSERSSRFIPSRGDGTSRWSSSCLTNRRLNHAENGKVCGGGQHHRTGRTCVPRNWRIREHRGGSLTTILPPLTPQHEGPLRRLSNSRGYESPIAFRRHANSRRLHRSLRIRTTANSHSSPKIAFRIENCAS